MRDYSTFSSQVLVILLSERTESLARLRAYVLLQWPEAINSWSFQQQEKEIEAIRRALAERQSTWTKN